MEENEKKNLDRFDQEIKPENKPRRANDVLQYQVFVSILKAYEKTLNLLKYTIILLVIVVFFLYSSYTGDTTREDYQIRILNDILVKLDENKLQKNFDDKTSARNLEKIINISHNTKQCGACHNDNNTIKMYASWNFIDFKQYLRGTKRIPQNNIMPNYTQTSLTDLEIEKIYEILKDGR